jgi:hypothetical protein
MSDLMRRYIWALFGTMLLTASPVMAQPDRSENPGPDYGVAITPAVYFVNFLFMYWANPLDAKDMPAYRAPIPPELAFCLRHSPDGCRYADYQQYFNGQDVCGPGNSDKCRWKLPQCDVEHSTQLLAPREFNNPGQINQPLGIVHATNLARKLGIEENFVLSPDEFQCLIGMPGQRQDFQDTIVACIDELTNSNGVVDIPLSSYGLAFDDPDSPGDSLVRSVCAPTAPCLRMNEVLEGPLEEQARLCHFEDKFGRLLQDTDMVKFLVLGDQCQTDSRNHTNQACMAETTRRK